MLSKEEIERLTDIDIEQVAEALKMTVERHKAICPFHKDSRPSLTFNLRTNRYRCYVCGAHGSCIDLVMKTQQWSFPKACEWLQNGFQGYLLAPPPKRERALPKPMVDMAHLEKLVRYPILCAAAKQFLYNERKIHPQVVKELGISSIASDMPMSKDCRRGWFRAPALLIPYRDIDGRLVSVQARYLGKGDGPRFQFPSGSECHIFNLPILRLLKPGEPLFITEGVTDCLALLSAGCRAIAIPSATLLKPKDLDVLGGGELNLHMIPDQDEPGERLFLQLREFFPGLVRHQLPPGVKDVGELYKLRTVSDE